MKRYFLFAALALAFPGSLLAFKNEPTGFRGVEWGSAIADAPQLNVVETSGTTVVAEETEAKMSIGGAQLGQLSYIFVDGRFTGAMVGTIGLANNQAMLDAMKAQFGEPIRPNQFMDKYFWKGKTTTIGMTCERTLERQCQTYFASTRQFADQSRENARKAQEAGKDF